MVGGFEKDFTEEMRFTYILILKYLQIQREKEEMRKKENQRNENEKVKTAVTENIKDDVLQKEIENFLAQD